MSQNRINLNLVKPIIDGRAEMVQGHRNSVPRASERVITWFAQKKTNVGDENQNAAQGMQERLLGLQDRPAALKLNKDKTEQNPNTRTHKSDLMQRISARQLFNHHVVQRNTENANQNKSNPCSGSVDRRCGHVLSLCPPLALRYHRLDLPLGLFPTR